jgi:hypothetical protein
VATARAAVRSIFDQSQPFGRLAAVHALQAAGSGLIAISLAGSLFFSISPEAAKSRVLLYLLLTIAPFALVGPALSPLLDRGREARRTSVAIAAAGSAFACFGMARNVHNLWLFPLAFVVLVLAKLYGVARAALVPEIAASGDDLAVLNARLAVIASIAGLIAVPFGVLLLHFGAAWVLRLAAVVFVANVVGALRLPRPRQQSLSTSVGSGPPARPARLAEVVETRKSLGLPLYAPEMLAGVRAVSVARAAVGFVEFFLAFELKRQHAATWWYGLLLVGSAAGSLIGSMVVPRLRRRYSERGIIGLALVMLVVGGLASGVIGAKWSQCLLTFVVGIAPMSAKPALDSQIQRTVPPALLGRTFGKVETRLQLVWVAASLVAVVIPFPLRLGDGAVAAASLLAAISYISGGLGPTERKAISPVETAPPGGDGARTVT